MSLTPEQIVQIRQAAGAPPAPQPATNAVSLSQKIGIANTTNTTGNPIKDFSVGLGASILSPLEKVGGVVEQGLDQTLGRGINAVTGHGFTPTDSARGAFDAANTLDTKKPTTLSGDTGSLVGNILPYFTGLGEEEIGAKFASSIPELAAKLGIDSKSLAPKIASYIAKAAPSAAKNTAIGTAQTGNIEEGVGLGVGGEVLGGAFKGTKYLADMATKTKGDVDSLAGAIVQGKKSDIAKAAQALGSIETAGVKTYSDLKDALSAKIKVLSNTLDQTLDKNTVPAKLDQLSSSLKVGEKEISHNYVDDALNQLDELYKKTNDPAGVEKIAQLRAKAEGEGLTVREINDLSRMHGNEFSTKAFSKTGDPLTSVNAQAFENTRTGIKEKARELHGNDTFKEADDQLSSLIRTRDLVQNMTENVNKLKQRIQERNLGEKAGYYATQVINAFTGGALKGAVQAVIPRGQGFKVLNALDLEKKLGKNLKNLQDILQQDLPEKTVIQKLQEMLGPEDSPK